MSGDIYSCQDWVREEGEGEGVREVLLTSTVKGPEMMLSILHAQKSTVGNDLA